MSFLEGTAVPSTWCRARTARCSSGTTWLARSTAWRRA